ncbi:tryptophan transporter [Halobacillus sp. BBL2006]|uniref:tryptophan transporter n=1 Tax=Halobacillus sp. BBL2006 TaxID=1543706 RepID=UPI0005421165|nr:tryptophan transporter [Halobacillus sp. BBL2006]KHE67849.1 tryptophan transporter [Halobacillus sp. BBL2006]
MNTRVLVMLSLFVGIGAVLHAIVPPFFLGMRPDMMLAMMFLGIILFPKLPYVLILSLATGFISALTTTVPGGQIANLIDKPITALVIFGLFMLVRPLMNGKFTAPVLAGVGTLVSGAVFLSIVLFAIGLMDASFSVMFLTVVLPTAALNAAFVAVIYPIAVKILKRTNMSYAVTAQRSAN